jgi:hypothetical protein
MKRNKLLLFVALVSVGCSRTNDFPTLLSQLEKSAPDEKIAERKLANLAADQCLKDIFSVATLKSEIKELEKKHAAGTKVRGKWKHLNFEDLPIPQANFLKSYGARLGDLNDAEAFDYSQCKDLPCIFNKIYGKEDSVAGYVHYLWYLKMGNYLTAHNTVYGGSYRDIKPGIYNEKPLKVSDYLWSEDELYGFWRLSHMIKAPHTELRYLTEIQRVPRGEFFGFVGAMTCGLAWSHGIVSLQDGCLSTGTDAYPGTFYESVLHELTHQVDYHEGKKLNKSYRSDSQDYLDLSKFILNEYKDEAGKTVRQWKHKEGIKLASSYAGTSPAENFAETIAFFRVDGSTTKNNISDEHWKFTSKSFQKSDFIKSWMVTHSSLMAQLAFKAVGNCSNSSQGFASTFFKKTDFITPLLPSMINCLGAKATEISKEIQSKVKVSDPDGCKVLAAYSLSTDWDPTFKIEVNGLMNKYLNELQTDKAYFAKVQAFHDEIPNRTMANDAFLSCSEIASEESCYPKEVIRLALEKIAPLNLPASHAQDLAELYLENHSLSDTREYINGYYKAFVQSHRAQIQLDAKDAWSKCESVPLSDDLPPTGRYFSVGDGYMVSSIFNCLNVDYPETAKLIVRNLGVGDLKVRHPKEEVILYEEVLPELQKSLLDIYIQKRDSENKAALEYIQNDNGVLRKQMLSDFVWVKDVLNADNLKKDCQRIALAKIQFPLTYQLRSPVFGVFVENACTDIHLAPEYNKWLEESKSVFAEKSVSGLEKRIVELANIKAKGCLIQFPVDTNLNRIKFKKEREACLLGEWAPIEAAAITEFSADPLVIKFKVDVSAVKSQLEINRRRLQLRVIKENF